MNGSNRLGRTPTGPGRDSRGRWVRRARRATEGGGAEFVFDDRVLDGTAAPGAGAPEVAFRLDDAAAAQPAGGAPWRAEGPARDEAAPEFGLVPADAARRARRRRLIAALAATAALAALAARLGGFDALVAGWLARDGGAAPFETSHAAARPADVAAESRARSVDRVVIPAVPPPLAPRGAQRHTAGPPTATANPAPNPPVRSAGPAPGEAPPVPERADAAGPAVGDEAPPGGASSAGAADEEAWFRMAEEYQQLGDAARAEELYRHVLDHGVQRGRAALALGDLLAARGDFQQASTLYRESTRLIQNAAGRPSR